MDYVKTSVTEKCQIGSIFVEAFCMVFIVFCNVFCTLGLRGPTPVVQLGPPRCIASTRCLSLISGFGLGSGKDPPIPRSIFTATSALVLNKNRRGGRIRQIPTFRVHTKIEKAIPKSAKKSSRGPDQADPNFSRAHQNREGDSQKCEKIVAPPGSGRSELFACTPKSRRQFPKVRKTSRATRIRQIRTFHVHTKEGDSQKCEKIVAGARQNVTTILWFLLNLISRYC